MIHEVVVHCYSVPNMLCYIFHSLPFSKPPTPKIPSPHPSKHHGNVIHCDIGFGPTTPHNWVNYCILFADKATCINIIKPLKTLKNNSLLIAFQKIINQLGVTPKLIHTDFDPKLISGKVHAYLDEKNIKIKTALPKCQDQNGLVERHW